MTPLHLYQTLHLNRGHVRRLAEHIAVLDTASRKLFQRRYTPPIEALEQRIAALARRERFSEQVSAFVRLELTTEGAERLTPCGTSLYDGYALRSVMPDAVTLRCELPFDTPTSAHEATVELARLCAQGQEAVFYDSGEVIRTVGCAPLFAVRGQFVCSSPAPRSVERDLGIEAAVAAGLEFSQQPLILGELKAWDELFCVDHRGVTALAHCDGRAYMALTAERIAQAMEGLFSRK